MNAAYHPEIKSPQRHGLQDSLWNTSEELHNKHTSFSFLGLHSHIRPLRLHNLSRQVQSHTCARQIMNLRCPEKLGKYGPLQFLRDSRPSVFDGKIRPGLPRFQANLNTPIGGSIFTALSNRLKIASSVHFGSCINAKG